MVMSKVRLRVVNDPPLMTFIESERPVVATWGDEVRVAAVAEDLRAMPVLPGYSGGIPLRLDHCDGTRNEYIVHRNKSP